MSLPAKTNAGRVFAGNHRVAYARTWIMSEEEQPARLEMGFDDGGKVWLNNQVVCEANTAGACKPGAHKADVALKKGENMTLVFHPISLQILVRLYVVL